MLCCVFFACSVQLWLCVCESVFVNVSSRAFYRCACCVFLCLAVPCFFIGLLCVFFGCVFSGYFVLMSSCRCVRFFSHLLSCFEVCDLHVFIHFFLLLLIDLSIHVFIHFLSLRACEEQFWDRNVFKWDFGNLGY